MARILIVDDEANMRRVLAALLKGDGHAVTEADGARGAVAAVAAGTFDVVITDQKMRDGTGLEVLEACKDADPNLPVVILTAFATVELAVEALRRGAFDFLTKPFNPDAVRAAVNRALERVGLRRENRLLRDEVGRLGFTAELLGDSPSMAAVKERITLVAPTNATVLITGETGTGKELAARAVHHGSPRANGPFLPVNCAALPETLLDAELFGHERGAFTGADRSRPGWFEAADGGTLFLDEAGEMSPTLQAKLLRVLNDRQVLRVGSRVPRAIDVRLILATHRDLKRRVQTGDFREDLYYRVAVVPIEMPALRGRPEDVPALVQRFLTDAARELKVPRRAVSSAAMAKLQRYDFPGNIRELRNLIERACILARGETIGPADFPLGGDEAPPTALTAPAPGAVGSTTSDDDGVDPATRCAGVATLPLDLRELLDGIEKALLIRALEEADGVQAEAARRLNLSRGDVGYKVRKYGLSPGDAPADPAGDNEG